MSVNNIYKCDKCLSVGQAEAFRLDPANFSNVGYSSYPTSGGGPMPGMPGGQSSTSKSETFQICSDCKPAFDLELAELFAQFTKA